MKIIFWGTPKYAAENLLNILKTDHEVIAVVTQPDRKRGRGNKLSPSPVKEVALENGIPVYTSISIRKDQNLKNILFNLNADIYIVVAFGQILPRDILDQPNLGCWNSHASLLPKWRGAAPIQWSIINDDKKTGVCIISMEEGLDTGPVIEQESTFISDKDNLEILASRLSEISSKLLVNSLNKIKDTSGLNKIKRLEKLKAIDQSNLVGNITYARQIRKEDYLINWNNNSRVVLKKIKGLYPYAYTIFKDKRIKILDTNHISIKENPLGNRFIDKNTKNVLKPGTIIMISKDQGIILTTKDSLLQISYGQVQGKSKTDGFTLSLQLNLSINDVFGH